METPPRPPKYSARDEVPLLSEQDFAEKTPAVHIEERTSQNGFMGSLPPLQHTGTNKPIAQPEEPPLDRFFELCAKQSPFVKAVIIAIITGIPFFIFYLVARFGVPKGAEIGQSNGSHATILELAKFLFVAWATFIGLLGCGTLLAAFSAWVCTLSKRFTRFQRLAQAVTLRGVTMLWSVCCHQLIPTIFRHSAEKGTGNDWVRQMQRAFQFISIAFAILIIQGLILELASVRYIQGWMGPRSQQAFDELDTIKQLHSLIKDQKNEKLIEKLFRKLFFPNNNRTLYHKIIGGQADDDQLDKYADKLWAGIKPANRTTLTKEDIIEQMKAKKRGDGRAGDRATRLFQQLDSSIDGEVDHEEVKKLVHNAGKRLKTRAKAQHGIKTLLFKLEILLTIVMLGVMFVIYGEFSSSFPSISRVCKSLRC